MKKNIIVCCLVLCVAAAVSMSGCIPLGVRVIKGSGSIVTRDFDVSGFNAVDLSGIGTIHITQGQKESLSVTGDDNIIENLSVEVRGSTLTIGQKRPTFSLVPTGDVRFDLEVKDINRIILSGAGSVKGSQIEVKDLEIDSSGLGNIELDVYGDSLKTNIAGAARFEVTGEVRAQEVIISGLGTYQAKGLISQDCKITISGSGNAEVHVLQELDIQISGLGSVEYMGSPSVRQNVSGGGSIKSIDQ